MKSRFLITVLLGILLFFFCRESDNYMSVYAQAESDSVIVDTTFTISYEAEIGKVSSFGCDVVYDSNQITFLGKETYGVFDHENIALQNNEQGRLVIGFSQFDCNDPVQNIKTDIFSTTFHVKLTASDQISKVYFENASVKLCDEYLDKTAWHGLDLYIQDINKFIMRMKLQH